MGPPLPSGAHRRICGKGRSVKVWLARAANHAAAGLARETLPTEPRSNASGKSYRKPALGLQRGTVLATRSPFAVAKTTSLKRPIDLIHHHSALKDGPAAILPRQRISVLLVAMLLTLQQVVDLSPVVN